MIHVGVNSNNTEKLLNYKNSIILQRKTGTIMRHRTSEETDTIIISIEPKIFNRKHAKKIGN